MQSERRIIIDAGPGLNFFACNQERMLIRVVGPLATPETVRDEILRKSQDDRRFIAAGPVVNKLGKYLEVLSDDVSDNLNRAVALLVGVELEDRRRTPKDLGELMVVAHGLVRALDGQRVMLLIDDQGGRRLAGTASRIVEQRRLSGVRVGDIRLLSTGRILQAAAKKGLIPGRAEMRALYERMRKLDDGLIPIDQTGLLGADLWRQ